MVKTMLNGVMIAVAAIVAIGIVPQTADMTTLINGSVYASYGVLALSLALIWGYAGILSFGQAAFFGLGGYAYAVAAINLGSTSTAACIAVAVAAGSAALLGYFMFWGRISDVYLGVITLTVSLILFRFLNQTAGDQWAIGVAPLGGLNGIPSTPIFAWPGHPDDPMTPTGVYVAGMVVLLLAYLICRLVIVSPFGRVVIAVRENEARAELIGYDTRLYKLGIFTLAGGIAGAGGVLFANCVFVSPAMFSLQTNGQLIIWVIVGGLGTLAGPVIGCFIMLMLSTKLGTMGQSGGSTWFDPNLVLGLLLVAFVVFLKKGLLPMVEDGFDRLLRRLRPEPATPEPAATPIAESMP